MLSKTRDQHLYYENILTLKKKIAIMIFQNEKIKLLTTHYTFSSIKKENTVTAAILKNKYRKNSIMNRTHLLKEWELNSTSDKQHKSNSIILAL